jgi:NitT/TauT family transport system ATP-binding protein
MTSPDMPVVFEHVRKDFAKSGEAFSAVRDLSFTVSPGERVAIVGETGSGKSTALALLLGLQKPTAGTVRVLGRDPFAEFPSLAGRLGIIFQSDRLMPWRTALDNASFGLQVLGRSKADRHRVAGEWLDRLGLDDFHGAYPHELSGGMRQRVAIARTMAIQPEVLVADEAFSALDELTAASVRADLLGLLDQTGTTTVFVTHSVSESCELADRVLVFARPGRIVDEVPATRLRRDGSSAAELQELVRAGLRSTRGAGEPVAQPAPAVEPDPDDQLAAQRGRA